MIGTVLALLTRINRAIGQIGIVVACALLVMMTAAITLQVISREIRNPIGWTEEVALASMVWVAFLVGPFAYRHHLFTRIEVLIEHLHDRQRAILNIAIHAFEASLLAGAVFLSWRFFQGGNSTLPAMTRLMRDFLQLFMSAEEATAYSVRNYMVYLVLPLGLMGMLLVSIEHLLRAVLTLATGTDHAVRSEMRSETVPVSIAGADTHISDEIDDDWNGGRR